MFPRLLILSCLLLPFTQFVAASNCMPCETTLMAVIAILNTDPNGVKAAYEEACLEQYPDEYNQQVCEQMVDQKLDQMIAEAQAGVDVYHICKNNGMCVRSSPLVVSMEAKSFKAFLAKNEPVVL